MRRKRILLFRVFLGRAFSKQCICSNGHIAAYPTFIRVKSLTGYARIPRPSSGDQGNWGEEEAALEDDPIQVYVELQFQSWLNPFTHRSLHFFFFFSLFVGELGLDWDLVLVHGMILLSTHSHRRHNTLGLQKTENRWKLTAPPSVLSSMTTSIFNRLAHLAFLLLCK